VWMCCSSCGIPQTCAMPTVEVASVWMRVKHKYSASDSARHGYRGLIVTGGVLMFVVALVESYQ
jgi:hypothetical protein